MNPGPDGTLDRIERANALRALGAAATGSGLLVARALANKEETTQQSAMELLVAHSFHLSTLTVAVADLLSDPAEEGQ